MCLRLNNIAHDNGVGAVKKGELKMKDEPMMLLKTHVEKISVSIEPIILLKNKLVSVASP